MAIGTSADRSDVVDTSGVQGTVTVTGTPIELKAGANRLPDRQILVIYNDSNTAVFTGPSETVTASGANKGIPLYKDQERTIPIGDVAIYAVTASGSASVLVQEYS